VIMQFEWSLRDIQKGRKKSRPAPNAGENASGCKERDERCQKVADVECRIEPPVSLDSPAECGEGSSPGKDMTEDSAFF